MPEKPKIEQIISEYLDGEMKKIALEFAEYMRESKIPLKLCATNTWRWKALYKGKAVCGVVFTQNSWSIGPVNWPLTKCDYNTGYEDVSTNERLKNSAWKNISYCKGCNKKCCAYVQASVFGKEFDKVCWMSHICFINPDADAIELAKIIIKKRCADISLGLPNFYK